MNPAAVTGREEPTSGAAGTGHDRDRDTDTDTDTDTEGAVFVGATGA
ncbi:hypothetical protein [Streptomyces sp. NPDC093109]